MVAELYWVVKKWAHDNAFDVDEPRRRGERLRAQVRYPNPHGGWVSGRSPASWTR
jgi:hypothetical protein